MKLFNLDAHCAVITDDKRQLEACGHSVTSVNLTGHHWVMNLPRVESFGKFKLDYIWDYTPAQMKADHPELNSYDGFIGTYPPLLIRKFEEFGKPMILHLPVRYDLWTSDVKERWLDWHYWFGKAVRDGRLFVSANSLYDVQYCHYFTGIKPEFIPSMCDYSGLSYTGELDTTLIWDARSERVHSLFAQSNPNIRPVRALYPGRYDWKNIPKHKAIVHVQYNASIMGFYEHYAMNIPLFVPTPKFLVSLRASHGAIGEITHRQCANNVPPGSFGKGTFDAPDPNEYNDPESLLWWTQYHDFYNLPHVIQFESVDDLNAKLKSTNFKAVSEAMKVTNAARKIDIVGRWQKFMEKVK